MAFGAQPNILAPQPYSYSNTLKNIEGIKAQRVANSLREAQAGVYNQQAEQGQVQAQFRNALASGDMSGAMAVDPQAGLKFQQDAQNLGDSQRDSQRAEAEAVMGVVSRFDDLDDVQVLQYAPIALAQLQDRGMAKGMKIGPETTAEQIREVLDRTKMELGPMLAPSDWTGGQAGVDPETGQGVVYQTDQYGNTRINPDILPTPTKGFSVTTADGTEVRYGAGAGQGSGLEKATRKGLEENVIATQNSLATLNDSISGFERDYLTVQGTVRAAKLWAMEKAGATLPKSDQRWYEQMTDWQGNAYDFMNEEIKRLTGAQMSEFEAKRLRKALPDPENDSPTQFMSKAKRIQNKLTLIQARGMYYLNEGLQPPKQGGNWAMSLDQTEKMLKQRVKELTEIFEAGGQSAEEAEASARASVVEEFKL